MFQIFSPLQKFRYILRNLCSHPIIFSPTPTHCSPPMLGAPLMTSECSHRNIVMTLGLCLRVSHCPDVTRVRDGQIRVHCDHKTLPRPPSPQQPRPSLTCN